MVVRRVERGLLVCPAQGAQRTLQLSRIELAFDCLWIEAASTLRVCQQRACQCRAVALLSDLAAIVLCELVSNESKLL